MGSALPLHRLGRGLAADEMRNGTFPSPSMGREVSYAVALTPSYASGERRYPVLYVLHGLFESHTFWERRGLHTALEKAREHGEVPEFLVVAVDGGNSFFVNSPLGRFEDLVTRDLIAHVEATYRGRPGREGRPLPRPSKGGYAARRIALKRPDLYR